jgi:DNA-binding CsgD family transcriptional regulator
VAKLPPAGWDVAVEIGRVASDPAGLEARAEAVLDALEKVTPLQAATILLLDPGRGEGKPLARRGYDAAVAAYMDSEACIEEVELLGFNRHRRPMRLQDFPVPLDRVPGWVEYLRPAGFRGGMGVGLFARDGRHLGVLGLNTDSERYPDEGVRDLIGALAPVIADAVDPLRSLAAAARMVHDAQAGVLLDRDGRVSPLPGLAGHSLLAAGSTVLAVAGQRLAETAGHVSFLCPSAPPESGGPDHVRVTVLGGVDLPFHEESGLVFVSPPGDVAGLTPRELEVLGLVVEGWSNQRIAAELIVAERTVAAHVEHILAKLGVASRTLAAVRALRGGFYVPRELSTGLR